MYLLRKLELRIINSKVVLIYDNNIYV